MTETDAPFTYCHTQKGPWSLLVCAIAAAMIVAGWLLRAWFPLEATLMAAGLFLILLAASFHHLTVGDEGNQLAVRFGPFPLFRRRIWYDDILEVEKGRTTFLDGWGIHWSLQGGWVWNICGRNCVVLRLKRGILRVGTNDPDGLLRFLEGRIATHRTKP